MDSFPGRRTADEIHLVLAQTPTLAELGDLDRDADRPGVLDYAEELFGPLAVDGADGKARTRGRTYVHLDRKAETPSLVVFPELAFSCRQLCARDASGRFDHGGLSGLIARHVKGADEPHPHRGGDLIVFAGAGHNSGRMVALTILAIAVRIAATWDETVDALAESLEDALSCDNVADRDRAIAKLVAGGSRDKIRQLVGERFRLPDVIERDEAQTKTELVSEIVDVALGMHALTPGSRIAADPFKHRTDHRRLWYHSSVLCELKYNFGVVFYTILSSCDVGGRTLDRQLLFSVFFKRRPMQNFEQLKVPLFGATYRQPLFKLGDFTFAPMICFDFIDESRDSSREVLKLYLETGDHPARERIIAIVMTLNGMPSQEVWWLRIAEMIDAIGHRPVTLVFAQVGYDQGTIGEFLRNSWDDPRADVFRNLSGVYWHAYGATFRDAGRKHIVTRTPVLHAKTNLWMSVWTAAVRYLEPCIVSGTLSFRLSAAGNRVVWQAQRAVMFGQGHTPWTPDADFEEVLLQVKGWLLSRRMPVSRTASGALRRLSLDLRQDEDGRRTFSKNLQGRLLWGGPRSKDTGQWTSAFAPQSTLARDDIYGAINDWAPVAMAFIYLRDQLRASVDEPRIGSRIIALLIPRGDGTATFDEPIVVWRPPPSVNTTDKNSMEVALAAFLAGFDHLTSRVTILVVGEYRLGFTGQPPSRFTGSERPRSVADGAAIEYEHWIPRRAHPGLPSSVFPDWRNAAPRLGLRPSYGRLRVRIVGNGFVVGLIRFEDDDIRSEAQLRETFVE